MMRHIVVAAPGGSSAPSQAPRAATSTSTSTSSTTTTAAAGQVSTLCGRPVLMGAVFRKFDEPDEMAEELKCPLCFAHPDAARHAGRLRLD